MKRILKLTTAALGVALSCGVSAADANKPALSAKHPQNYTCEDLLVTDFEYVPEVIYWHDGWNDKSKTLTETITEDWEPIAVDEVFTECQKDPSKKVADVVARTRAKHAHKAGAN